MTDENIFIYALDILETLKDRAQDEAESAQSHSVKMQSLAEASAYHRAWWILLYASHNNWEDLKIFDPNTYKKT